MNLKLIVFQASHVQHIFHHVFKMKLPIRNNTQELQDLGYVNERRVREQADDELDDWNDRVKRGLELMRN